MKLRHVSFFAALCIAASPAMAKDRQLASPAPVPAPAQAQNQKAFKVGDRVPGSYTYRLYTVDNPAKFGLEPAPYLHVWVLIDGVVYLVDTTTDRVKQIAPATAR